MKAMMRDKDPERGINSGKSRKEISSKRKIKKKSGRRKIGRGRRRDTLILIISRSVRERERKRGGRLNREMNIKQTEMEGGE